MELKSRRSIHCESSCDIICDSSMNNESDQINSNLFERLSTFLDIERKSKIQRV